jgi:hypothetical protein
MTYRTNNYHNNQQNTQELINEVVAHFDYLKVHQAMNHLNWTWYYSQTETKVPSIGEIVFRSMQLLNDVLKEVSKGRERAVITTGGFKATAIRHDDGFITLDLEFVLTDWSAGYE